VLISVTIILTVIGSLFGPNWPALVEAQSTLPPRDSTPAPPSDNDDKDSDKPLGAHLDLQVQPVPPGAWSMVQWQDTAGNWHNVAGWQRDLGIDGFGRWWVAAKDFNSGPFRWVVTQGLGGPELGVSQSFNLPAGVNQALRVEVALQ
jgi:hypothetical protein